MLQSGEEDRRNKVTYHCNVHTPQEHIQVLCHLCGDEGIFGFHKASQIPGVCEMSNTHHLTA